MKSQLKLIIQRDFERPLLAGLLVFVALMTIIGFSWRTARQDVLAQQKNTVDEHASFIRSAIQQRFNIYEDTLRSANGLFLSSDTVERSEWKDFIDSMELSSRYPGIRSVGYINIVPLAQRADYTNKILDEGINTFHIYPEGDRSVYASVTYSVPTAGQDIDDRTAPLLGFDAYSDPIRKSSMDSAASSGELRMSHIVNLTVIGSERTDGFVMYMPYYAKGQPHTTLAERSTALSGFFFAPFVPDAVFNSVFNIDDPAFGFAIYDGDIKSDKLIYKSVVDLDKPNYTKLREDKIKLYGQTWTIAYSVKPEIVPASVRARPLSLLVGGTIFSAAMALVIYLLIQRRTRELRYLEEKKLEEAKDDLLSLASHQLRTPATAVKQYVSMVKEGFAGDVTAEQRKLLQMAYDSNERQLTIVDDLLYVARIDAGKAKLRLEQVNVSELVQSVIEDLQSVIKARKQAVDYKKPSKAVLITADPQYLRMIFENLLSNASKYSFERTQINVLLAKVHDDILISFEDKGVGIDPDDYHAVFMKFSRIPNKLSRQISGSGIGLYLAKQLALLHDGDINFESAANKGSTFTVTLPRKKL